VSSSTNAPERVLGLFSATGIGVAAIVGGGVLALAGPAFASAGGSAILAIALNGVIALITAMSFAELATTFPQSGGAYVFANKVLSIGAAFGVGWVLWFAYIVACVLYALGFAAFAILLLAELCAAVGWTAPAWLASRTSALILAGGATAYYVFMLIRHVSGGGQGSNIAKLVIFAVIAIGGGIAMIGRPLEETTAGLSPFFAGGVGGLVHAMGLTFVILHGFEVIAAVGGEVKEPNRVIPRAMFLSVAISLAVYIPLLLVTATVGVPSGASLSDLAAAHGDIVVAVAVREFMGPVGYALVIAVAVLAFLTALRANIMGGSRIAQSMARDRTLPPVLAGVDPRRRTPLMALYATGIGVIAILFVLPDVEAAGAAASLIFLLSFALAHVTAYLARKRVAPPPGAYRTPWFPLVPAIGVVSCTGLAVFEAIAVPDAGGIAAMWLAFGVLLYFALFRTHAEIADASAEAFDPDLGRLRGKAPLVLVPIANPAQARTLVEVANALAPSEYARVMLLSAVPAGSGSTDDRLSRLTDAEKVVSEALTASLSAGYTPDALITTSGEPWAQIRRIAQFHECESILLGLGEVPSDREALSGDLEDLINDIDCDAAIMRAPAGWSLAQARRIVVPIGGRGDEHQLRARVLGRLSRTGERDIRFVTVVAAGASDAEQKNRHLQISRLAQSKLRTTPTVEVIRSDDPIAGLRQATENADLVILGLKSTGGRRRVSSPVSLAIASQASCATLLLSARRPRDYTQVYRPLRDAFGAFRGSG
jgi:basic amino acid/polyamine antiporter, APA family